MLLFLGREITFSIITLHILFHPGGGFLIQHDHISLVPVHHIFLLHQLICKKIYFMFILTLPRFLLQIFFIRVLFILFPGIHEFLAEAFKLFRKSLCVCRLIYTAQTIHNL